MCYALVHTVQKCTRKKIPQHTDTNREREIERERERHSHTQTPLQVLDLSDNALGDAGCKVSTTRTNLESCAFASRCHRIRRLISLSLTLFSPLNPLPPSVSPVANAVQVLATAFEGAGGAELKLRKLSLDGTLLGHASCMHLVKVCMRACLCESEFFTPLSWIQAS